MDSMAMKEEIEYFKKKNGNVNYTERDMMMYLVAKIDKIDDRLNKGTGKIAQNRESIKYIKWMLGGLISGLFGIAIMFLKIYGG